MHHFSQIFSPKNKKPKPRMDPGKNPRKPKLGRVNAAKNIDYEASPSTSSSLDDFSRSSAHSMNLSNKSSFRIDGLNEEFDRFCESWGFNGPDDFAISTADWEARKVRSSSDLLPRPTLLFSDSPKVEEVKVEEVKVKEDREVVVEEELPKRVMDSVRISDELQTFRSGGAERSGINGVRPPVLKPPPSMRLPVFDNDRSTWDILKSFAPQEEEEEEEDVKGGGEVEGERNEPLVEGIGESNWGSFTTSNDDDSSSSTTEPAYISPNMRSRPVITSWVTGKRLGRGSFGTVYEGIAEDGTFFALKEVSLLDQDSQGRQSIHQLEQEIALLSEFQHENIVQYYGTHSDGSKLYIFLELVSQGSLMSLYQRFHLLDSHVSAYTRQILCGLKYLHDQDVVHRDIKCGNILVDVNGSVKLADFGLAKATKLNDVKSCKGTAFWMAPEVVNGKGQGYGLPADIWSLGCTVLEMLTHKLPYSEVENPMQALFRIGKGIPPAVPDFLSKDARDFILQCLKVNPNDRPTAASLICHPFVKRPFSSLSGSASPFRPVRSI